MKITTSVEFQLKPFTVPNYVMIEPRIIDHERVTRVNDEKLHLTDLDSNALDKLCREFRDEVFKKAGKQQPPTMRYEK